MEKKNSFGFSSNRKAAKKGGFLFGGTPKEEEKAEAVELTPEPAVPSTEPDSKMRLPPPPTPMKSVVKVPEPIAPAPESVDPTPEPESKMSLLFAPTPKKNLVEVPEPIAPAPESVDPAPEPESKMRLSPVPAPKESVMEDVESMNPPIQKSQKGFGIDRSPSPAASVSLRERLRQYQDLKGNLPGRPDREKELDASKLDSWAGPPAQLLDSNDAPPPAAEGSGTTSPTKSPAKPPGSPSDDATEKSWVPASLRPPLNDNEEIAYANEKSGVFVSPRSIINDDGEIARADEKSGVSASIRPPLNDDEEEIGPLKDGSEELSDSWVPRNDGEEEEIEEEVVDDEFDEVSAASIGSAADYEEEVFDEEEELEVYEQNEQTGEWDEATLETGEGEPLEEEQEVLDEYEAQEFTEATDEQELVEEVEEISQESSRPGVSQESWDPAVSQETSNPAVSQETSNLAVSQETSDEGGLSDEEEDGYIPLRSALSNDGDDVVDDVDDAVDDVLDESQGLFDMIDDEDSAVNEIPSIPSESEVEEDTMGWVPVPADEEVNVEAPPQAAPPSERSNRAAVAPVGGETAPFEEKYDDHASRDASEQKIDYGKKSYRLLVFGLIFIAILAAVAIVLPFLIDNDDDNDGNRDVLVSSTFAPTLRRPTLAPSFLGQTPGQTPGQPSATPAPSTPGEIDPLTPGTSAPTAVPTLSPTTQRLGQFVRQFLIPLFGEEVFQDRTSPQFFTAAFMADEDEYIPELDTLPQLADRFGAILFYFSTGGDNWISCYRSDPDCVAPGQGPWLSGDACDWFSITCDAEGRITSINFGKYGCSVKCLSWPFGTTCSHRLPLFLTSPPFHFSRE
jgi:hypothetical protein